MKLPTIKARLATALVLMAAVAPAAHAGLFTFVTASGATNAGGDAVKASATVTTSAGTVTIVLNDLLANPKDVAQLISDFDFVLSTGATTGTLTSSSGQQITVNGDNTTTLGSTGSTGWGLNNNVSGGLQLDALGFVGPAGLILGPGPYTNANSSIAGNGPHNPFLNQSATFTVSVTGVTVDTTITKATFSFGTTAGNDVPGVPSGGTLSTGGGSVPEPTSVMLLGTILVGITTVFHKKVSRRA